MKKILVANRGEPVIRAVKTFRRMGIATAVVYAPEDVGADWLAEVDYAFSLTGDHKAASLYLDGEQIVAIAKAGGCDGLWPAWGFLAEHVDFAEAVIAAGLTWIGPHPAAMRALGSKAASSALAKTVGVPTVPEAVIQPSENAEGVRRKSDPLSFPLLLKPALGGGGQGQAIVRTREEFPAAWEAIRRINAVQFQEGPLLVQRYIEDARHIEVQVLADTHGTIIVFHERECSIQRRNQKIIEESPSPALTPEQRAQLQDYARALATAAGYTNAGTLEFLFADGRFYFLEMNTRLQVEHPITEETTRWIDDSGRWRRIDLLEEMVLVARGERLRFVQAGVRCIGHAIEARIYAEDPARNFCPSPGTITGLRFPVGDRFRVETAVRGPGSSVDPRYDPMVAKLIAWGETRDLARRQLALGLERTAIGGVTTNVPFLYRIMADPDFAAGRYSTRFVSTHPALCTAAGRRGGIALAVAAVALSERDRERTIRRITSGEVTNVAAVMGAIPPNGREYGCTLDGQTALLRVEEWSPERYLVRLQGGGSAAAALALTCVRIAGDEIVVALPDGATCAAGLAWRQDTVAVTLDGEVYDIGWGIGGEKKIADPHAAPGGGRLVKVIVEPGRPVRAGEVLYVTEAMKMEARVVAAFDGIVRAIHAQPGEAVEGGQAIVTIDRSAPTTTHEPRTATWTPRDLQWPGEVTAIPEGAAALELLQRYFHGYDPPRESIERATAAVLHAVEEHRLTHEQVADGLAGCCDTLRILQTLFSEDHAHATIYFVEHLAARDRRLPKATEGLLEDLAHAAGLPDLRHSRLLSCTVLHWLQATRYQREVHTDLLLHCLERLGKRGGCQSAALHGSLRALAARQVLDGSPALRTRWREVLRDFDWEAYYAIEQPPVAREYWDLYEQCLADPLAGIAPPVLKKMRAEVGATERKMGFQDLTPEATEWLGRWFAGFSVSALPVSRAAEEAGVSLFLVEPQGEGAEKTPRLVAVAGLTHVRPTVEQGKVIALPEVERAAIEAYWALRAYEAVGMRTAANHVFCFLPRAFVVPAMSAAETRRIAARVQGFARHLRIVATEAILTIGAERKLIQIWHAREVGVLSRPPMALAARVGEAAVVGEKAIDLRQQRLGKLLNRDRARLLFDEGAFTELAFPEVDDQPRAEPVGLNVYRGAVGGTEVLAYGSDFRHRGGALGEREGKKLAASVVLAYAMQVPLIGIHDGAGANIKGSVAALGWAGAYFGATAATGGFSTHEKFCWWLANHHERAYFEKVLNHFEVRFELTHSRTQALTHLPLIHLHLHLGAAVGMLVYGPSISSLAIMVDQPEVYRLLTGAATVERVTGEKGTNYTLGGAPVHSRVSGEIDLVFRSEEAAMRGTRELLAVLRERDGRPSAGPVRRRADLPQVEIPVSGGVIVGREVIEANVDDGVFYETREALQHAGGLLTGYARLNDQPVVLAVTATDYGMHHGRAFKKMQLAAAAAHDFGLPLILVVGANWDRLHPVVKTESIYQQYEMRKALRDCRSPKIGIALGPRSLERSIHEMMDLLWYVERGTESVYERQRAHILAHGVAERFSIAMDWCADILRYLPRPWELETTVRKLTTTDPVDRLVPELAEILPRNINQPYDMRAVIARVFDDGSFREFSPADGQPLHIGLATLGGQVVGMIADAPNVEGGAQTVVSISKFTRFHRFCARFGLPIVELNDSPAFRPGKEQEQSGIQGEGGKSIREETLSTIPKITVTLRQNYGGRYIHANLVTLGPPRRGLVIEGARLGVMGAEGAVGVLYAKELATIKDPAALAHRKAERIAEYERTQLNPEQAVELGYADAVVPIAHLRRELHRLLLATR